MTAFPILPILGTVSAYTTHNALVYCPSDQLRALVEYVTGSHFSASLPSYLQNYITTGIVVCGQYPRLIRVEFLKYDANPIRVQGQLDRERARLGVPLTLDVQPPSASTLAAARSAAPAIEQIMLEKLTGVRK